MLTLSNKYTHKFEEKFIKNETLYSTTESTD